ncbi:Uncharacterised protein [Salmonella enterica subsp. enterica serovar Typhi]|nr:Uncharacterised protein [Salmonella enterica subsp. enterica serovar Typhi]CQT90369.1 Uncharacterised protein [Salmonella enterica subsp. enterica serovar Typhi]CQW16341.1 Uncharacterised protein [Salmonella enterica subsp. enterica serovar Typhi]CQW25375.1 Uncharacterised protein [Salmonella enterica subsp. enterica serovar Typhi]CQY60474.1 Uncharacterised protein [Salmonella enterica subsp. enterica serovar Typhi]
MQANVGVMCPHGMNKRHTQDGGCTGGHTDADVSGQTRIARSKNGIISMTQRQLCL